MQKDCLFLIRQNFHATPDHLELEQNYLHGAIPTAITDWASLSFLSLAENSLSGPLPEAYGESLHFLLFNTNDLSGTVPVSLARASSLQHLALEHNPSIVGTLPSSLGGLPDIGMFQDTACTLLVVCKLGHNAHTIVCCFPICFHQKSSI